MAGCHTERWDGLQRITTFQILSLKKKYVFSKLNFSTFSPEIHHANQTVKPFNILFFAFGITQCFLYASVFKAKTWENYGRKQKQIWSKVVMFSTTLGIARWMPGWSTLCPAALLLARGSTLSSVQSPPTTYTPGHAAHQSILWWIHNTWKSHLKYMYFHIT